MVPLLPRPRSMARKMVGKNRTEQQQQQQKEKKKKEEEDDEEKKKSRKLTRLLITVSVAGSTGPLRFVVDQNDVVSDVIQTTLKSYAHLGRLPLLGSNPTNFLLYSPPQLHALCPKEAIGCCGGRNFILWKKEANVDVVKETIRDDDAQNQKRRCCISKWKSCFMVESKAHPFVFGNL